MKNLETEVDAEGNKKGAQDAEEDLEHFMQQVQGDREMRQHINLYKKKDTKKKQEVAPVATKKNEDDMDEDDDEEYDDEEVRLDELLDDMSLNSDLDEEEDDDEEDEDNEKDIQVLSPSDAAKKQPAFQFSPSSGFDPSAFDPKSFKFV